MKKGASINIPSTDMNSDLSLSKPYNSKASFIENDFLQMQNYIKNLEKTVAINKEIINDLCSKTSKTSDGKFVDKLNIENKELLQQVKKLTKERDELQTKVLVSEQIIDEFKKKENEMILEYDLKIKQMRENENKSISENHKKCKYLEEIIDKLNKDLSCKEREEILQKEKSRLETTLNNAHSRINELEIKLEQLSVYNETCPNVRHNLNKSIPNIPSLDLSRIKNKQGFNNSSYIHKLEESIKILTKKIKEQETQNKQLAEKNIKLHQVNDNLYKVNENLSITLNMMKQKLKNSHGRRAIDHSKLNRILKPELNFLSSKDQLFSRLKPPIFNSGINEESGSAQEIDTLAESKAVKEINKKPGGKNVSNKIILSESFDLKMSIHDSKEKNDSVNENANNLSIEINEIKLVNN